MEEQILLSNRFFISTRVDPFAFLVSFADHHSYDTLINSIGKIKIPKKALARG
ncbi:MAG: hypothetical protein LBB43_06965 [Spirochaetaceae bacterium]|nr:hypothetical protein [Spirochaetaceae bacterium]